MNSFRSWFERFMIGRYGVDDFSKFQLGLAVVLMLLNMFLRIPILNTLLWLLLIWAYIRIFSRNIQKRYAENAKYLTARDRLLGRAGAKGFSADRIKRTMEDRKKNHIYKCPKCSQKIRIPRGKGRIMITCPKCRTEFMKKS